MIEEKAGEKIYRAHLESLSFSEMSEEWFEAKDELASAKEKMKAINAFVTEKIPGKDEGVTTKKSADKTIVCKVTRKINRKVDENYLDFKDQFPQNGLWPVKEKPSVSVTILRQLEKVNPGLYRIALNFITEKPGTATVEFK